MRCEMERSFSTGEGRALFGAEFSIDRVECIASAVLESPPELASRIAQAFFNSSPADAPIILATLFSDGDLETAHRIVVDASMAWDTELHSRIRGLMLNDIHHPGLLPCGEQRTSTRSAIELFDRYVAEGERAFRRDLVVLPGTLAFDKFMLMEIDGSSYLRIGGRFHRDILQSTIQEFSNCGARKSACRLAPRGGGMIDVDGDRLLVFGESSEFGRADLRRVQRLILQTRPEVEVVVRYGSSPPRA